MDYEEITNVVTRERELEMSAAFPVLMRKVYLWMSLALVITGFTAYYVATTPALIGAIITNQILGYWRSGVGIWTECGYQQTVVDNSYADVCDLCRY